jgi:shikimate dehydrogenase
MHEAALAAVGLDGWRYLKLPVPPELFAETMRALPAAGFRGVNVTIPHKEGALALAGAASDAAREIGAANTLTFEDGAIHADNTDAPGLIEALGEAWAPAGRRVLVLGAGGAARAAVWALVRAGAADVAIWNRTPERARALADRLGARAVDRPGEAEIVVNCTSVGLGDEAAPFKALPLQADSLGAGSCVVDMVYRDGGTRLLEAARTRGADVIDGLEVLVAQGAASFERWTGRTAPREAMRAAVGAIAST